MEDWRNQQLGMEDWARHQFCIDLEDWEASSLYTGLEKPAVVYGGLWKLRTEG